MKYGDRNSFRVYLTSIFHTGFNEILFVSIALRVVDFPRGFQITLIVGHATIFFWWRHRGKLASTQPLYLPLFPPENLRTFLANRHQCGCTTYWLDAASRSGLVLYLNYGNLNKFGYHVVDYLIRLGFSLGSATYIFRWAYTSFTGPRFWEGRVFLNLYHEYWFGVLGIGWFFMDHRRWSGCLAST